MNKAAKRRVALLLALCLLLGSAAMPAARAEPEEVTISSVRDLLAFAEDCALDAWSRGKTVRLTADLNLTGRDFVPIPTFGGVFLGEGHSITGLRITAAGSSMGLFRYLQEGAVIQDLRVSGSVRPSGSAVNVGGLVGSNAGAVRNCKFTGTVEGASAVGGIAGLNRETGEISLASTSGAVAGEEFTGGTVGRNLGILLRCENDAKINTAAPGGESVLADIDSLTLSLEDAPAVTGEEDESVSLKSHSDTGGVAGYSSGAIYGCRNTGAVGYPHVGYNVGGIAGRQSGHLDRCTNQGEIHGRKDVGGIVGQAEPDVALSPDAGTLDRLRRELDTLEALISQALDRGEESGDRVSARLDAMGLITDAARDHAGDLMDGLSDSTGETIDSFNSLSVAVTKALGDLGPALDALSSVSEQASVLAERLEAALDGLGRTAGGGEDVSADAARAAGIFRQAGRLLTAAVRDFRTAADALQNAVIVRDQAAADAALAGLTASLERLGEAMEQAGQAIDALHEALGTFPALQNVRDILREQLAPALAAIGASLRQAGGALNAIHANTGLDWEQVRKSLREAGLGLQGLQDASQRLNEAVGALQDALGELGGLSGRLGEAVRQLGDAAGLAVPMGRELERAFSILRQVAADLAENGPTQLSPLGENVREAGRGLFDSMADLSQELKDLHGTISEAGDRLSADLRAISRQFNTVLSLLLDALSDTRDGIENAPRDLLEDTSGQDIDTTLCGKVENCRNEGAVDGDRNVGGAVGAMSIEYDPDPEGDLELSLGGTYETKAVLLNCINQGSVTAKKDCAGGLAGRMDLGAVLGCENYGSIESSGGGYVGGVVGLSEAVVRNSCAKCRLSGVSDVGGIAGWAAQLRNCYAIATILEGAERLGAIAGSGDPEDIQDCFFVNTGAAGIDGVSYAGSAEPIGFESLRQVPGLPTGLTAFTLTLLAEGEVVQEIPFAYGEDLRGIRLPAVPEREGFYGAWPDFDVSGRRSDLILEAIYTPWVTLVASEARGGKLALALAEGTFTEETTLQVFNSAQTPPGGEGLTDVWEVSLVNAGAAEPGEVSLRLLNRSGGKAGVWQYTDGGWNRVETRVNGSYLCLTMAGTSGVFCVRATGGGGAPVLLLGAAGVLLLLPAALLLRGRRKGTPPGPERKAPEKKAEESPSKSPDKTGESSPVAK